MSSTSSTQLEPVGNFSAMRRMVEARHLRKQWEADNPELARAWNEAWEEDEHRTREREAAEASSRFAQRMPERLEEMGVPPLVTQALTSARATGGMRAIEEFRQSGRPVLLLVGPPGCGKTVAAASALRNYLPPNARFVRAVDLARLSLFDQEQSRQWDTACEIRMLVLDDLGMEHANDFWLSRLDALVDARCANPRLRTVITSNLDVDRIRKQYGIRVTDRLVQTAMIRVAGQQSLRRPGSVIAEGSIP